MRATATPVYRTTTGQWTFSCHECEHHAPVDATLAQYPDEAKRAAREHRIAEHGGYVYA